MHYCVSYCRNCAVPYPKITLEQLMYWIRKGYLFFVFLTPRTNESIISTQHRSALLYSHVNAIGHPVKWCGIKFDCHQTFTPTTLNISFVTRCEKQRWICLAAMCNNARHICALAGNIIQQQWTSLNRVAKRVQQCWVMLYRDVDFRSFTRSTLFNKVVFNNDG